MSLFKESIQDHLTPGPVDTLARASYPGMAHFAGTGPNISTCRECDFWGVASGKNPVRYFDYYAKGGMHGGGIKPHPCRKFKSLTQQEGQKVPDNARACKYFEQAESVPDRFKKS